MIMASRRRSILLFPIYLLYGCVLTCVLLVVRFPATMFRQYCAGSVERTIPGTTCVIGGIDYDFPLTLRIHNIRLTRLHSPKDVLFYAKRLSVSADPVQSGFRLVTEAYDGRYECRLLIRGNTFSLTDIKIHHLDLGQWDAFQRVLGRKFSGYLDVTGEYSGRFNQVLAGEAKGIMAVREGSMELLQPILSLSTVTLQSAEMEFHLQDQMVIMKKGHFHGAEINGTFSGTFRVVSPLGNSMLELSGDLTPLSPLAITDQRWKNRATVLQRGYKQSPLPFVVNGTLASPLFRFGG